MKLANKITLFFNTNNQMRPLTEWFPLAKIIESLHLRIEMTTCDTAACH